jgi:hypothetical protein
MTKLLNRCKNIFAAILEGIQEYKSYKLGKVK